MKIEGLGFAEAVERLAGRYGVQLRYEDGDGRPQRRDSGQRPRLLEAHKAAAEFYAEQLAIAGRRGRRGSSSPSAASTRTPPSSSASASRRAAATRCSGTCARRASPTRSSSPAAWSARGSRGLYDRFRGRLLWPIRERHGDVIGFGARRLFDDDRIEAKYLNTPETPIYKKSQVLYGVDLARREIARAVAGGRRRGLHRRDGLPPRRRPAPRSRPAAPRSARTTRRVLRRLLLDHDEFRGEVIFTFDGDEAGQKAALRAFEGDQQFVGQTYVAVEPDGLDPCDLRLQQGDAAVRELVARRVPLYRFVLGNVVSRYDLDRADGRVDAMREAARLVVQRSATGPRSRRSPASSPAWSASTSTRCARRYAGQPAAAPDDQRARTATARDRPQARRGARPAAPPLPDLRDPRFSLERETLKLVVQHPEAVGRHRQGRRRRRLHPPDLPRGLGGGRRLRRPGRRPDRRSVGREAARQRRRPGRRGAGAVSALAVEPLLSSKEPDHGVRRRARLPAAGAHRACAGSPT